MHRDETTTRSLGFSFLFDERRAMVRLETHPLGPGLTLLDYEAEIPGVSFPLQAPLSPDRYRHRRCRVRRMTLELEPQRLAAAVFEAVQGAEARPLELEAVRLEGSPGPLLAVEGRTRSGGYAAVVVPLAAEPTGSAGLAPRAVCVLGEAVELPAEWLARLFEGLAWVRRPIGAALTVPFARAGWKAPDGGGLRCDELESDGAHWRMRWSHGRASSGRGVPEFDARRWAAIRERVEAVRSALRVRGGAPHATFAALVEELAEMPLARACAMRWWVESARGRLGGEADDLAALARATAGLVELRPEDPTARRFHLECRLHGREVPELLARMTEARRRSNSKTTRLRYDVARARLLVTERADRAAAKAVLEPWEGVEVPGELGLALLRTQAMVHADDPPRARRALAALREREGDAERYAADVVDLARAFREAGTESAAAALLREMNPEALRDRDLRASALELASHAGALEVGLALVGYDALGPRLELGARLASGGRTDEAARVFSDAATQVEPGSEQHRELARGWVSAVEGGSVERQSEARAELRRALGRDLPAADVRAEALLLEERDQPARALDLVEAQLEARPVDELLLSTFKQLCLGHANDERWFAALERAAMAAPEDDRERWLLELAASAVEVERPEITLDALERLPSEVAIRPDLLDQRCWAIDRLGRRAQAMAEVRARLQEEPDDPLALAVLVGFEADPSDAAQTLLELSGAARDPAAAQALVRRALALAESDRLVLGRALRRAIALELEGSLRPAWEQAFRSALEELDEGAAAELLAQAEARGKVEPELAVELAARLDEAIARMPAGPHLHRRLWQQVSEVPDRRRAAASRLRAIAVRHELRPEARAEAFAALADACPDRTEAITLLAEQAERELVDESASTRITDALLERGHLPTVLRVLGHQAERATTTAAKVAALKRLAHVHADLLGDMEAAARHLETALEHAPTDADLLLPLLDHCFERKDLSRAIRLTARVLEHVPMGEAAFLALAHRAADAAVAQGEVETAEVLLQRAANRAPDDRRTHDRVAELEALQGAPEHRVQLLGTIAARQSGRARIEALEERARLLVDPLGRPERAIVDLEAILAEDPRHGPASALLRELYAQAGRWRDVVELLEREFPRQHGVRRCLTLQEIADIHRHELLDLPRAEQALRIALDHLGDDPEHRDLAESMRTRLVGDLQGQGRYVDLSIYLERALAPELSGEVPVDRLHPRRAELLVELARIYRGPLDDESKAARVYERLEKLGRLPDEGLATLARAYRRANRHADLVRILDVRAKALAEAGELQRKAAVDERIGELLEGPLGRPHEAAGYFLEAYLADPKANAAAGAKARVLLSGVDAVANVRRRLLSRLEALPPERHPALLTLLGDILGPQEEWEEEAELRYRQALAADPEHAAAYEALGRLLARQGRLQAAAAPLGTAATHPDLDPDRAAENAAIAARVLVELQQDAEAERVLKHALGRAPESQRALLELARLYEKRGRTTEHAIVLETLSQLPLSSMLGAEVAFRRAMLLMPAAREDPYCPEAERARAYLLEAVSADGKHVAARQTLLDLATARLEWSVVAHMHYLAIRDLPAGPQRALVHLDLAETYLDRVGDVESATRNIESAVQQAPDDLLVTTRAGKLAERLPDPRKVADRFERIASAPSDLLDPARARLWLLAADLRIVDDDLAAAEAASRAALDLPQIPFDAATAAQRNLELLADDEARDLRQQKSGLLRLLESEEQALERLHILGRLREIGQALGDRSLVEWASREQLDLAERVDDTVETLVSASSALREVYAERGAYDEVVTLYEQLAARLLDPPAQAEAWVEAASFAWHGLREGERAVELLRRALALVPGSPRALAMLGEVTRHYDDPDLRAQVYAELARLDPRRRPLALDLELARLARGLGHTADAVAQLRPLTVQTHDDAIRLDALRELDAILARAGAPADRLPTLRRYFDEAQRQQADEVADIAAELTRLELTHGHAERAGQTVERGLQHDPEHRGLLGLQVELLQNAEQWDPLARTLERLALRTAGVEEQAKLLVRAARVRLDHQSTCGDAVVRRRAVAEARRLLIRACETAPALPLPRAQLLPLSFSESRWDEVLELAIELRAQGQDDEECLLLAGLTEAYRHGQRSLARDLGFRHDHAAAERFLYPGLRQLLTEVAQRGPLPRLDALLASAAALAGGRTRLNQGLRSWAAGRPVQSGLALGLARLAEAEAEAELARSLYQIGAFMAPDGPVPALVARLPLATPPRDLDPASAGPLEGRSAVRRVLWSLRDALVGLAPDEPEPLEPPHPSAKTRLALADTIIEPWRRFLRHPLPVAWTHARHRGGVAVELRSVPTIVVGPGVATSSVPELRFRLAFAVAGIASGQAILEQPGFSLRALLELLQQIADPTFVPSLTEARELGERLAPDTARPLRPQADERRALLDELRHWLAQRDGLERLALELARVRRLYATRLSGQLDGALLTLAHDHGFVTEGRPDPVATLRTDEAHWLLRAMGLY